MMNSCMKGVQPYKAGMHDGGHESYFQYSGQLFLTFIISRKDFLRDAQKLSLVLFAGFSDWQVLFDCINLRLRNVHLHSECTVADCRYNGRYHMLRQLLKIASIGRVMALRTSHPCISNSHDRCKTIPSLKKPPWRPYDCCHQSCVQHFSHLHMLHATLSNPLQGCPPA